MTGASTTAPRGDIPLLRPFLPEPKVLMPRLESVLYSGIINEGEEVWAFERELSARVGGHAVLCCSSGTAALHLALIGAGVGPGDDVVSTPITAEPTNMAILHAGAGIRWADVDPETGNVTPASVAAAITPSTRAIVVVHYAGAPVDIDGIRAVARGIPVIEDAAHAWGAGYKGAPIGTHSEFTIFSFQAIKHLTTIDGGALVVRDPAQVDRLRRARWFGLSKGVARSEVNATDVGYKYNMNNVTAVIGRVQLAFTDRVVAQHRANGQYLDQALPRGEPVCAVLPLAGTEPSYWVYTILVPDPEEARLFLADRGIGSGRIHRRNDLHSVFAKFKTPLPGAATFWDHHLHIPCGWWVGAQERERITEAVAAYAAAHSHQRR